jgi:hypothetical protein
MHWGTSVAPGAETASTCVSAATAADAEAGPAWDESASIKSSAATAALDKPTDLEDIAARLRY